MENTKQQSAVEWLEEQLFDSLGIELTEHQSKMANEIFFKQAKEMFEKQIIDCSIRTTQDCFISLMDYIGQEIVFTKEDLISQRNEAEQYYNETFKK